MTRTLKTLLLLSLINRVVLAADLQDWKWIASISGNDKISEIHVTNLLLSHGIKSVVEGSVLYGISVPPANAEQASQLLRTDARKLGYGVWFGSNEVVKATEAKQVIAQSPVSSVLKKSEYGSGTALGRFLRSKDISQLTTKYPYVVILSVRERQYLATPKTYSTGYDVEIELKKSPGEQAFGYRGWYQVYDSGRRLEFLGSHGSK